MKLQNIKIKKFRSIEDANITINDFTAIVGQNNCGKSSILKALNCFFNYDNEENALKAGEHIHGNDQRSFLTIECSFVVKNPSVALAKYVSKNVFTCRMRYRKGNTHWHYKKNKYQEISYDDLKEIPELPSFFLVPTFRSHDQIHGVEDSLLRQLAVLYISSKKDTVSNDITSVGKKVVKVFESMQKDANGHYPVNSKLELRLGFKPGVDFRPFFINELKFMIREGSKEFLPRDCGAGVQSSIIIALIRLLAEKSEKPYILGLEEPEANLHPQAQREIVSSFVRTTNEFEHIQVVTTTHSNIVLDSLEHEKIALCQKETSNGYPITKCYQLPVDFASKAGVDADRVTKFFKYKNSDFFFSNLVIICEGPSDVDLVTHMAKREKINLLDKGVSFLQLGGVHSLIYPITLLKNLGIPFWVIVDKDFFLPYKNDKFEDSLDTKGLPTYKKEFCRKSVKPINILIRNERERESIRKNLLANHSQAMKDLKKHNIICFNYSLELDLLNSKKGEDEYRNVLGLPETASVKDMAKSKALKDSKNVIGVVDKLENRNLPHSYNAIRRFVSSI